MISYLIVAIVCLMSYLVGSISPGYSLARWYGIDDIRAYGSGNSGATNVARVLGKQSFVLVLMLDALKAYSCLFFLYWYGLSPLHLANSVIAQLCGNRWPVQLQFRGGKGVATAVGCVAFLNPKVLFFVAAVWLGIIQATGIVGIASVGAAVAAPLIAWWSASDAELIFFVLCFIMVWIMMTHKDNIRAYINR